MHTQADESFAKREAERERERKRERETTSGNEAKECRVPARVFGEDASRYRESPLARSAPPSASAKPISCGTSTAANLDKTQERGVSGDSSQEAGTPKNAGGGEGENEWYRHRFKIRLPLPRVCADICRYFKDIACASEDSVRDWIRRN